MARFKRLATLLPIAFAALLSLAAHAEKPFAPPAIEGATTLSAEATIELIQNEPTLLIIDSRRYEEFAKGHIEGSINLLDTEMDEAALAIHTKEKARPLLFYCNGERCLRSANAVERARSWGYRNLHWFRGGWQEWIDKELPVTRR